MVLLIALIAIGIASNPDSKVLGLVSYAWAGFGAAFGPVVLISLLWKRMTRNGALVGMLVGAVTVVVWKERSEEHTSELQSLMRISYAVFCLKKKKCKNIILY